MSTQQPGESAQTQSQTPPKKKHIGLYILIAALIAGGGFWYYKHNSNQAGSSPYKGGSGRPGSSSNGSDAPQPIQAIAVIRGDQPVYLSGLGTVTATSTVTIHSRVDGELQRLHFTEGDMVKAGQLLAELDPRPFQVQLSQAQGQLAKDQAQLTNARQDLERYKTLLTQDSIAQQQVDAQTAQVRQLEGTVKADQAQVDSAQLQLTYSRVTAPITGRAGLRQVDIGNIVHAGDTNGLVVLTQVDPINVLFTLPEAQLHSVIKPLHDGQTLAAEAWDRNMSNKLSTGKLVTMDNQIDTTTGTIKLKAEFANPDRTLFPNQFVNVRLKVSTDKDALIAPISAIQKGSQGSFVWVVREARDHAENQSGASQSGGWSGRRGEKRDGDSSAPQSDAQSNASAPGAEHAGDRPKGPIVTMHVVKTGATDGDRIVIREGVREGDLLVTDGADRLRDGMAVEVVDPNKVLNDAASAPAHKSGGRGKRGQQGG